MKHPRLLAIAYHEAGHAVLALYQGLAVKSVSIEPDPKGRFLGRVSGFKKPRRFEEMGWDTSTRKRQQMEREVRQLLAGELAQRRYAPRSVRSYHGQADRESALMLLDFFAETARELPAYSRLLEVQTELLLAKREVWAQVEALAVALVERRTIAGRVAAEIMRAAFRLDMETQVARLRARHDGAESTP